MVPLPYSVSLRYDPVAMADAWRAECPTCRWTAFADQREAINRLANEHVAADTTQAHIVSIGPTPRDLRR
jgi:hypothetical protein